MALSTATVDESTFVEESELFGSEARLSWVLAGLPGYSALPPTLGLPTTS
jgi:hypothetical protein